MAAPKPVKALVGDTVQSAEFSSDHPARPLNLNSLAAAVVQLQNTVDELIERYNEHTHGENAGATYTQNATTDVPSDLVDGSGATAPTNLFTAS